MLRTIRGLAEADTLDGVVRALKRNRDVRSLLGLYRSVDKLHAAIRSDGPTDRTRAAARKLREKVERFSRRDDLDHSVVAEARELIQRI
mgnify:FL=1